jgi:hypothetical protein
MYDGTFPAETLIFQMRLEIPCVYAIFHEYFLKSSVGDSRWKASCLEAKALSDPLVPVQGEAFAMIILKNNYFAWLWECKMKEEYILFTDYDSESELRNKINVGEAIMKKAELNLEQEENDHDDDDGTVDASSPSPHPVGTTQEPLLRELDYENILVPESTGALYRDLRKKTEAALKKARRAARTNGKYKDVKKSIEKEEATMATNDVVPPAGDGSPPVVDDEEQVLQEQRAKKRKILKSFREYTNPQEDEGRFKGWSRRASEEMESLQMTLNEEMGTTRARLFRAAFRMNFRESQRSGKKKRVVQESAPPNYQSNIWGLGDIPQVEI